MSLRLTTDYRVLQHISAFALAWIAASYLFAYVLRPITIPQPSPGYHIDTLGKGQEAVHNLLYLSNALREDQTIVLLGSSELDPNFSRHFIPTNFFPQTHLSRVVSFGRAGFDTLGMYGLLDTLRPHLNTGSRLVIVLSPAWFRITDLWPRTFNEDFNDTVLLQLYLNDDPRSVFHDYLSGHQLEFNYMTPTQKMFLGDPSGMLDWNLPGFVVRTLNARAYAQREKLDMGLASLAKPVDPGHYDAGNGSALPWDEYEARARQMELRAMAGNDMWVRNKYYRLYAKRRAAGYTHYFLRHMNPEPEMNGLKLLLQLLKTSKVHALFVMQPVNSRIYDDLTVFDSIDARIAGLCREYNMDYLDMYAAPLEPGVLGDGQHLGELGWERVDREITRYFRL